MARDGLRSAAPVRAALACAVLVAALAAPATATPREDLRDARAELAAITGRIEQRSAELADARVALAAAEARVDQVVGRLAAATVLRARLDERLAVVRARLAAAQAELDVVAADLYMGAAGTGDAGGVVAAMLGSTSLGELGDRLTYGEASSRGAAEVAGRADAARRELERRQAAADVLVGAQAVLVGSVAAARDERAAAIDATRAAIDRLDADRAAAVDLVERLAAEAGGLAAVDLSGLRSALHGPDSLTYGRWGELFLQMAGAPTCRNNLVVVAAWQAAEGTLAAWNPLATTHRMPGSTSFNSVGVQDFMSLRQGLQGTWETIRNGWDVYRYGAIVRSLRACARPMTTARAINASSWCPGCTGGMYVLNVVPHVQEDLATYLAI